MLLISLLVLHAPILQANHTDSCELTAHNFCINSCKIDVVNNSSNYQECLLENQELEFAEAQEVCADIVSGAFAMCEDSQNTGVNSCTVARISTSCSVADATAIPTLSEWGMILLMMILGFVGYRKSLKMER